MIGPTPAKPVGNSPAAYWCQWVHETLLRTATVGTSRGAKVSQTVQGTFVEPFESGTDGNAKVRQYLLIDASKGDYFICRTINSQVEDPDAETQILLPVIGSTDVFIAKPFHLRQSPFDRDVINAADPTQIGLVPGFSGSGEITYDIEVESWNGSILSTSTRKLSHDYKSATFRIVTDQTDATDEDPEDGTGDNWFSEQQTIIPRFVPAVLTEYTLNEETFLTTETAGATIIHAVRCSGMVNFPPDVTTSPRLLSESLVTDEEDGSLPITLLALSEGWAWARVV